MSEPRLRMLAAAGKPPLSVRREDALNQAETQMLLNDYSQLPVMNGERTVHGLLSWKSIGKARVLGTAGDTVADCMDTEVRVLSEDKSLLQAVGEIIQHEIVLVHDKAKKIVGIVTTTDLSVQLKELTDAFLLVGNIERHLRRLLRDQIPVEELNEFVSSDTRRPIQTVSDLSFGEYVRVLEHPGNWRRLGLNVDQRSLITRLEEVRKIRNSVMHFRTDALDGGEQERLRLTESFLATLRMA